MVTEDDCWAEAELERQLAALTPIDCIEDAQNKFFNDFRSIEEEPTTIHSEKEEEEGLPPSVEQFINKLQEQVALLDKELFECHNLIQYQSGDTEYVEELEEDYLVEEEEEGNVLDLESREDWVKHVVQESGSDDENDGNDLVKVFNITVKYSKPVKPEIDVIEAGISNTERLKEEKSKFQGNEKEKKGKVSEEKEKRTKQLKKLEEEREKIERFQQEQMRRLEEEVMLAEADLLKEVQEHEAKLKEMEDQNRRELELYEKEKKRAEIMLERRNNEAAVRIQAHFKGMRARNKYGTLIKERMIKKREEILKEQLAKYERIIEEEKAALKKEIRDKEEETKRIEMEKKRKEEREKELKLRYSEKEKMRLEQERREKSERLAKEVQRKEEEEERLRMETERELHWIKSSQVDADKTKKDESKTAKKESEHKRTEQEQRSKKEGKEKNMFKQAEEEDDDDQSESSSELIISPTISLIRDSQISIVEYNNGLIKAEEDKQLETQSSDQIDDDTFLMMDCIHTTMSGCLDYVVDQVDNNRVREEENENCVRGRDNLNIKGAGGDNNKNQKGKSKGVKNSLSVRHSTGAEIRHSDLEDDIPEASHSEVIKPEPSKPESEGAKPSILSSLANKAKNFFKSTKTEEHVVEQSQAILAELNNTEINDEDMRKSSPKTSRFSPRPSNISPNPTTKFSTVSKLRQDLEVARSFDSSRSPIKSPRDIFSPTAQSLDLDEEKKKKSRKTASDNARSEYRRRRKIREGTESPITSPRLTSPTLTSPIGSMAFNTPAPPDTSTPMSPSSKTPIKTPAPIAAIKRALKWDIFNKAVEDQHSAWVAQGKVWDQDPAPPRLATAHVPSNSYTVWDGDVVSRELYIEDSREFRVEKIVCDLVSVRRCEKFVVNNTDNMCLSIEDCKEMILCISHSSLQELSVVRGDLNTVPKLCASLLTLDLSYNSITRIDPAPCKNLTSLSLSHNKLRSTRGLSSLPNIITLDLSYNCITSLQGIGNCSILHYLNLSHNQLAQPPILDNHLLLATLDLSSNGFTDVDGLESSWLPSLAVLDLSSNGLTTLPCLYKVSPFLSSLHVSHNMLDDVSVGLQFLVLESLRYEGNDVDEASVTEYLENAPTKRSALCFFGQLCLAQRKSRKYLIQKLSDYSKVGQQRGQLAASLKHRTQLVTYDLDQYSMLGLTEEMFCAFTECDMPDREEPLIEAPVLDIPQTATAEESPCPVKEDQNTRSEVESVAKPLDTIKSEFPSILPLQCLLRGHLARLALHRELEERRLVFVKMIKAANVIQNVWRGYSVRKLLWPWLPWLHRRIQTKRSQHIAAVRIQSVYKGYILRKKLACLMEQTQYELNDIDFGEEVPDLEFDEDALERGWELPPTPQVPQNNTPIPNTPHRAPRTMTTPVPLLPLRRSSTSNTTVSEISLLSLPPSRTTSKPPSARSNRSHRSTSNTTTRGERTQHKADIAAEWGMKNNKTVDMLIRRSHRFGDKLSEDKKREILRKKIMAMKVPLQRTPPPPTTAGSLVDLVERDEGGDIQYQWTMNPIQHARKLVNSTQQKRESIPLQVYKNPRFWAPSYNGSNANVKLPPLSKDKKKGNMP